MDKMKSLSIDLETFSDVDLKKCGVYRYAESPKFEILLFAYSEDNGPVQVVDLACGEEVPEHILAALTDEGITKWAYNASFERVCLSYWLRKHHPEHFCSYSIPEDTVGYYLDPSSWKCSRIWGAYMGLPLSLEGIGAVLKLNDQKMKEGKDLIRYFCVPCKPTKTNGGRTRNLPEHDREKWETFKSYNKRDVEVELAVKDRLTKYPVPEFIWDQYHQDQEINDRGIGVDMQLVRNAISIDAQTKHSLLSQMQNSTGLENPNSVSQMKGWLSDKGIETESLDKKAVKELLPDADSEVADVLLCRQQLAKSSVSKYKAMENMVCTDSRARGCFMFYGASRSGRWAGRGIQLQNLPQNHMEDLEEARNLVRDGNFTALELLYDNIPQVLSELIRTAFVPRPGYKYIVSDFSAIEARVLDLPCLLAHQSLVGDIQFCFVVESRVTFVAVKSCLICLGDRPHPNGNREAFRFLNGKVRTAPAALKEQAVILDLCHTEGNCPRAAVTHLSHVEVASISKVPGFLLACVANKLFSKVSSVYRPHR